MNKEDIAIEINLMQDKLGAVWGHVKRDNNQEARRQLAFLIGSANGLYDVLVKDYYDMLVKDYNDSIRKDMRVLREGIPDEEAGAKILQPDMLIPGSESRQDL